MADGYLLLLFIFILAAEAHTIPQTSPDNNGHYPHLSPEVPLMERELIYHQPSFYQLTNLAANSQYEILISYEAYSPSSFRIEFAKQEAHRSLLNTEKLVFSTNDQGCISLLSTVCLPPIQVSAIPTGVRAFNTENDRSVIYNIVLHRLKAGLPVFLVPFALITLTLLAIVLYVVHPRLVQHFMTIGNQAQEQKSL